MHTKITGLAAVLIVLASGCGGSTTKESATRPSARVDTSFVTGGSAAPPVPPLPVIAPTFSVTGTQAGEFAGTKWLLESGDDKGQQCVAFVLPDAPPDNPVRRQGACTAFDDQTDFTVIGHGKTGESTAAQNIGLVFGIANDAVSKLRLTLSNGSEQVVNPEHKAFVFLYESSLSPKALSALALAGGESTCYFSGTANPC